jgi:hypothetical protein
MVIAPGMGSGLGVLDDGDSLAEHAGGTSRPSAGEDTGIRAGRRQDRGARPAGQPETGVPGTCCFAWYELRTKGPLST